MGTVGLLKNAVFAPSSLEPSLRGDRHAFGVDDAAISVYTRPRTTRLPRFARNDNYRNTILISPLFQCGGPLFSVMSADFEWNMLNEGGLGYFEPSFDEASCLVSGDNVQAKNAIENPCQRLDQLKPGF